MRKEYIYIYMYTRKYRRFHYLCILYSAVLSREYVYEIDFPEKTTDNKDFVEDLWARRKVGFLLDQIRINGEKKELVEEVTALAKKYGITTPYTSFLIVPDAPAPVAMRKHGAHLPEDAKPWEVSANWNSVGRNRRSVTMDLTRKEGQEAFYRLVAKHQHMSMLRQFRASPR